MTGKLTSITVGGKTFDCKDLDNTILALQSAQQQKKANEFKVINSIVKRFTNCELKKVVGFNDVVLMVSDDETGLSTKKSIEKYTTIRVLIDNYLEEGQVVLMEASQYEQQNKINVDR